MGTSLSLVDTKQIESGLAVLRHDAETLTVRGQQSYIDAAQIENACKAYVRDVKAKMGPGIESAKSHLDFLKSEMQKYIIPAETILETIKGKRLAFAMEEKRQAKIEEDRKNAELAREAQQKADADRRESERISAERRKAEEAEIERQRKSGELKKREADRLAKEAREREEEERKRAAVAAEQAKAAPPPRIEVKSNIPTIAGIKNQTFYFAEMADWQEFLAAYRAAVRAQDTVSAIFLEQFIEANEQAIGKYARDTKSNALTELHIPGVRATSRG